MTILSVNLNKIALLRNSRGRDFPNVVDYAEKMLALGVQGITVHPRQDERHITRKDTEDLSSLLSSIDGVEFNVEGFPSKDFLGLIEKTRPDQCTLVPDGTDQLTSDHGWQVAENALILKQSLEVIRGVGARAALFLDPDVSQIAAVAESGYDRIELYTEAYADSFGKPSQQQVLSGYVEAKDAAISAGLGVNAGHDLDLENLATFLAIGGIQEVSIGHALTIESINQGYESVVKEYLQICSSAT